MTVILPNSVFLHIPKTGGVWVRETLKLNNLHIEEIRLPSSDYSLESGNSWHNVPVLWDRYIERPNRFCFVRHPMSWYASHWAFRHWQGQWQSGQEIDSYCEKDREKFSLFVECAISEFPNGYLGYVYSFFANHATFAGKLENLKEDLSYVLGKYEGVSVLQYPQKRLNVTPHQYIESAKYTLDLAERLMEVEKDVVSRYDYNYILESLIL